jgi:hypothetical protein
MADTVAGAEPESAAKKVLASTVTRASPPAIAPTRLSANSTSRLDIPPDPIRFPAYIKNGIARSGKDSNPDTAFWAIIWSEMSGVKISMVMAVARPVEIPMGNPRNIKTKSAEMIKKPSITRSPLLP